MASVCSQNYRLSDFVTAFGLLLILFLYVNLSLLQGQLETLKNQPVNEIPLFEDTNELNSQDEEFVLPPQPSKPVPAPLNISSSANEDILLFTPIKATGSTAFKNLLSFLRKDNLFHLYTEPSRKVQPVRLLSDDVMRSVVNNISAFREASAFVHSFAYVDFEEFGAKPPLQVTLVREPVDRAVSLFYRSRSPYQIVEFFKEFPDTVLPSRKYLKKSLEMCLESPADLECRFIPGKKIPGNLLQFFCGQHKECLNFGSETAFKKAKENVLKSYSVVGILELMPQTLAVLERYLPRYFNGATAKYYGKIFGEQSMMNRNFYRPEVDRWALEALKKNFTVEEKFYEFLKDRLLSQYQALL